MQSNLARLHELTNQISSYQQIIENFFKHSPDGLLVVGSDSTILSASEGWQEILGYSSKELHDRKFFEFIHPDDLERTRVEFEEMRLYNRKAIKFCNRWIHKDGHSVDLVWNASAPVDGKYYSVARLKDDA